MDFLTTNSTRQYGANRDFKLQKIYTEVHNGKMIFKNDDNILAETKIIVYAIQDVTNMTEILEYPTFKNGQKRFHKKYGPYRLDDFEYVFNNMLKSKPRNIRDIYSKACDCVLLIKEYSENLLLTLYEDAFNYSFAETSTYIEKVNALCKINPYLVYRLSPHLIPQLLTYNVLSYGMSQSWIDPERGAIIARHYDIYFKELWKTFISNNFRLPDYVSLSIAEYIVDPKIVGDTILSLLLETHDERLNSKYVTNRIKRLSRDVKEVNGSLFETIHMHLFI